MQAIQQECQELLTVVLLVPAELRGKLRNLGLERTRRYTANTSLQGGRERGGGGEGGAKGGRRGGEGGGGGEGVCHMQGAGWQG